MRPNIFLRSILLGMLVAFVIGCGRDPATSVSPESEPPEPPRDLAVTKLDSSIAIIAGLSWRAPADSSGITGYRIWWSSGSFAKLDSMDVEGGLRGVTIANLKEHMPYLMEMATMRGTLLSARVRVIWISGSILRQPDPPYNLMAASAGPASINLRWSVTNPAGLTYAVRWVGTQYKDSGAITGLTSTFCSVNQGLRPNQSYIFWVQSFRDGLGSESRAIAWAGATRYTMDTGSAPQRLRLYEPISSHNSALTIDPVKGGPMSISAESASENVQLAMNTLPGSSTFVIGPARALPGRLASSFDSTVYVSDSAYAVPGLDMWFTQSSIRYHILGDGNRRTFTLPATLSGTNGIGFYFRIRSLGAPHYGRVFIRNVGGKLLQGTEPDRYIELEISYQQLSYLEYAKRVVHPTAPSVFASRILP